MIISSLLDYYFIFPPSSSRHSSKICTYIFLFLCFSLYVSTTMMIVVATSPLLPLYHSSFLLFGFNSFIQLIIFWVSFLFFFLYQNLLLYPLLLSNHFLSNLFFLWLILLLFYFLTSSLLFLKNLSLHYKSFSSFLFSPLVGTSVESIFISRCCHLSCTTMFLQYFLAIPPPAQPSKMVYKNYLWIISTRYHLPMKHGLFLRYRRFSLARTTFGFIARAFDYS